MFLVAIIIHCFRSCPIHFQYHRMTHISSDNFLVTGSSFRCRRALLLLLSVFLREFSAVLFLSSDVPPGFPWVTFLSLRRRRGPRRLPRLVLMPRRWPRLILTPRPEPWPSSSCPLAVRTFTRITLSLPDAASMLDSWTVGRSEVWGRNCCSTSCPNVSVGSPLLGFLGKAFLLVFLLVFLVRQARLLCWFRKRTSLLALSKEIPASTMSCLTVQWLRSNALVLLTILNTIQTRLAHFIPGFSDCNKPLWHHKTISCQRQS